jgi:hypothetical protein
LAGLVAQTLIQEGLQVTWTAPAKSPDQEHRGYPEFVAESVTVVYVVKGIDTAIRAAVTKARERLRDRGTLRLEHELLGQ